MITVTQVKTSLVSGFHYLRTTDDGTRIPEKVYYVTNEDMVQVHDGPGLVNRRGFPKSQFEPIVCLDDPQKCLDSRCDNLATKCRLCSLYCPDCYHHRF